MSPSRLLAVAALALLCACGGGNGDSHRSAALCEPCETDPVLAAAWECVRAEFETNPDCRDPFARPGNRCPEACQVEGYTPACQGDAFCIDRSDRGLMLCEDMGEPACP